MKKMNLLIILGLVAALCLVATPVLAVYSCDPLCGEDPNGSEKCCFGTSTPASGNGIVPDKWNDNPTCKDLGFDNGTKIDPPDPGNYPIPDTTSSVTVTTDGTYFNWTSTLGIDAVLVKGGDAANLYLYDPPADSFGDTGLVSPLNNGGQVPGLSHIDFCYNDDSEVCDCPFDACSTGICNPAGECIFVDEGIPCGGGVCDGEGNCGGGTPVPEFPSLALPAAMGVGLIGAVLLIRKTREQ